MSDQNGESRKLALDPEALELDSLQVEELEEVAGGDWVVNVNCPGQPINAVASCGGSCVADCAEGAGGIE